MLGIVVIAKQCVNNICQEEGSYYPHFVHHAVLYACLCIVLLASVQSLLPITPFNHAPNVRKGYINLDMYCLMLHGIKLTTLILHCISLLG